MARTPTQTADDTRRELLEELRSRQTSPGDAPLHELSAWEREVDTLLRERDHREGCPVVDRPGFRGRAGVEATGEPIAAPGPALRELGLGRGDVVVTAHCRECGAMRYFAPPPGVRADDPEVSRRAVEALLTDRLERALGPGGNAAPAELDGSL